MFLPFNSHSPQEVAQMLPLVHGNWAQEWRVRHSFRHKPDNPSSWDKRAAGYGLAHAGYRGEGRGGSSSQYTQEFLRLLHVTENSSVLDIGCGPGTLSLSLLKNNCTVYALDFSQAMLSELLKRKSEQQLHQSLELCCCAWEDNWVTAGITRTFDYTIASRSIVVSDLEYALAKMSAFSHGICAVSISGLQTPSLDLRLCQELKLPLPLGPDYIYVLGILAQYNIMPQLQWIHSTRTVYYDSVEHACDDALKTLRTKTQLHQHHYDLITQWFTQHLVPVKLDDSIKFVKDYPHIVHWAYIQWNACEALELAKKCPEYASLSKLYGGHV